MAVNPAETLGMLTDNLKIIDKLVVQVLTTSKGYTSVKMALRKELEKAALRS